MFCWSLIWENKNFFVLIPSISPAYCHLCSGASFFESILGERVFFQITSFEIWTLPAFKCITSASYYWALCWMFQYSMLWACSVLTLLRPSPHVCRGLVFGNAIFWKHGKDKFSGGIFDYLRIAIIKNCIIYNMCLYVFGSGNSFFFSAHLFHVLSALSSSPSIMSSASMFNWQI